MAAKILIADDYEDNLELLRLLLTAAEYEVYEAHDGFECVAMAKEQPPDLIMIDLSMPVMDGWAVFRELKGSDNTSHIPCVAVTARADTERERALQVGFSAYLPKPFRGVELLEMVKALLTQHQAKAGTVDSGDRQVPGSLAE